MYKNLKFIIPILFINFSLFGQQTTYLKGIYGSMNLGIGIIKGNITSETANTTPHFAMHINIGVFVCKSLQAGLTFNGWLYEPYRSMPPEYKGESISNGMLYLQLYPVRKNRFFFKGAYGMSEYTNLRPGGLHGTGNAFMGAFGYEKEIGKGKFISGIQVSYSSGNLKYTRFPATNSLIDRKFQTIDFTIFIGLD
jgi:hypothetical protein